MEMHTDSMPNQVQVPLGADDVKTEVPLRLNRGQRRRLGWRGGLIQVVGNHFAEQRWAMLQTDENGRLTSNARTLRNRAKRARKETIVWV
jgi:hypothetical protein